MANPRNIRFYDGIRGDTATLVGDNSITFTQLPASGSNQSSQIGMSCAVTADSTVGIGASGNPLFGIIEAVEADGNVAVRFRGFRQFSMAAGLSTTLPVAGLPVACDGIGGVIKASTGNNMAMHVDTTNNLVIVRMM